MSNETTTTNETTTNETIVYVDSILSALKLSNKQFLEDILKSFDDKIENFLGFILEISPTNSSVGCEKIQLLTFDGKYYLKSGHNTGWLVSRIGWNLDSCRPVAYSFDIKDKQQIVNNLGFSSEPIELRLYSITIEGDQYLIIN